MLEFPLLLLLLKGEIMKIFKLYSNVLSLIFLILIASVFYFFTEVPRELLAIIVSPFFTLVVFLIIEERKTKWNARYDAFKTLYANRGNIVNDKTINCLNSIDILFIDDKNVRTCWNNLYATFNKATEINALILGATNEAQSSELLALRENNQKNMVTGLIELLMSMSVVLGLNKDITYRNLSEFYNPVGLSEGKAKAELDYYQKGAKFFQEYKP